MFLNTNQFESGTKELMSYEEYCDVVKKFEVVPVEVPQALSSKWLNEIDEIFSLFEDIEKPGFVATAELFFCIKCIGIHSSDEEMEDLLKQESE